MGAQVSASPGPAADATADAGATDRLATALLRLAEWKQSEPVPAIGARIGDRPQSSAAVAAAKLVGSRESEGGCVALSEVRA